MWKSNVMDVRGEILCISQFTLYGNTRKGNKPDFHNAMVSLASFTLLLGSHCCWKGSNLSKDFYQAFLDLLKTSYEASKVKGRLICLQLITEVLLFKDGKFGAMMSVQSCNEVYFMFFQFEIYTTN
jgi:D-aminoacyl-tRNA deacylase